MINVDILCRFIKLLGVNYGLILCYFKIIPKAKDINIVKKLLLVVFNIIFSLIQGIIITYMTPFSAFIPFVLSYSIFLSTLSKTEIVKSIMTVIISLAISYIMSLVSLFLASLIFTTLYKYNYMNYISFVVMAILNIVLTNSLFKLKRLKHGFSFLENDFLNLLCLSIATVITFAYVLCGSFSKDYLEFSLVIFTIISFIIIRKSFIIYQKQKLQTQALKDCEKELQETKEKLRTAIEEKDKLVKSNHEFYHRQEALKNKLNILAKSAFSSETANEFASIMDRIDNLSKEYTDKITNLPKLTSTGIVEIDDMLNYMQSECIKNNIEFIFKLECNINNMIDKLISKSELETLIGDLLRNAIIAINHSKNSYRSIMLVFGMKDSFYTIDVYDSGINFEIETLLKLGLEKCSTHLNDGGTSIGMLTTFEILENTKASFIITEYNSNSYSKMISVQFDNLKNYIIHSYRASEIKQKGNNIRNIIISD